MSRQIVVTSSCQTGGIAATLQSFFPSDRVIAKAYPFDYDDEGFRDLLLQAQVWVYMPEFLQGYVEKSKLLTLNPSIRLINICSLLFDGFHPDLCYVRNVETGEFISMAYNSAIGFWAYKNGLDIADAEKLFTADNYHALGYFDRWEHSVQNLRARFAKANSDIDFLEFYIAVKRHGKFMHTINHPKVGTLVQLARQIARKIDNSERLPDQDVSIDDYLSNEVWPLYPEVADELSLAGASYTWKTGGQVYSGIREFLEYSNRQYLQLGLASRQFGIAGDEAIYDRVLGPQLRTRP
jgi:hypothetical protein